MAVNLNGKGAPKRLADLTRGVPCEIHGNKQLEIKSIACHSGQAGPGALFVAIDGFRTSGSEHIDEAINRGAVAVATSDPNRVRKNWVTPIYTKTPRRFLAQVANRFYDFPTRKLALVGVTGTNGKTTTTWLLRQMARAGGVEPGLVGTIEQYDGAERRVSSHTTPESLDLVRLLARLVEKAVPTCIAEVSSHSLELDRVFDLDFRVAVFTNLTQDHLDFHRTIDNYRAAKMRLFAGMIPGSHVVTNLDDAMGRNIPHETRARVTTYGTRPDLDPVPDVSARVERVGPDATECVLTVAGRDVPVRLRLLGRYNVWNLAAAFAAGRCLGWPEEQLVAGAEALVAVPGRLEPVTAGQAYKVFVDYAHTPDALKRVLATVREFTAGRVIVVFGCGGDRDRGKRPLMGEQAAALADVRIVTSDNPRTEAPDAIIAEVLRGMGAAERVVEPDRKAAIAQALTLARPGDAVVIAGKGHEDYQIVGTEKHHFDDREVARELLERSA